MKRLLRKNISLLVFVLVSFTSHFAWSLPAENQRQNTFSNPLFKQSICSHKNILTKVSTLQTQRITATRKLMQKNGYDALLMTDPLMLLYFTDKPLSGALVLTQHKAVVVVDAYYKTTVADLPKQFEVFFWPLTVPVGGALSKILPHFKGSFAVGPSSNLDETVRSLNPFFKSHPQRHLILNEEIFQMIRRHKEKAELQNIKKACEITQAGMELAISLCKKGISEKELSSKIKIFFLQSGADIAYEPIVAFGKNSTMLHWKPSDERLNDQDLVFIDCGAVWNNYLSDMSRVIFLKTPSKKLYKFFKTVEKAYLAILKKAKAGITCSRLNEIAEDVYKKAGLQKYVQCYLGHGVGLAIHEAPYIIPDSQVRLIEHDVISIEPGLVVPGLWGFHLENTLVVHKNKLISFMTMPFYLQVDPGE
jgi:Xaa-Pro aminopeptidase